MIKMKKNVYLHIGMGKTGTTALQTFAHANFDKLAEEGFLYTSVSRAGWQIAHHEFASSLWVDRPYWMSKTTTTTEQLFMDIFDDATDKNINNIVISSELLFFIPHQQVKKLSELLESVMVKVICYIRRIDSHLPSIIQQGIKAQGLIIENNQLENFETAHPLVTNFTGSLPEILKPWLENFPKESIVVRPYEKGQFIGGNIFSDFLNILNLELNENYELPARNSNPRLCRDALEYKLLLNKIYRDSSEKTTPFIDPLLKYSEGVDVEATTIFGKTSTLLSPSISYMAYKHNEEFYNYLAKEYLKREDGKLFFDPLPDPDEPWLPYHGLVSEKAYEITKFLHDCRPDLVKALYQGLSNQNTNIDEGTNEENKIAVSAGEKLIGQALKTGNNTDTACAILTPHLEKILDI